MNRPYVICHMLTTLDGRIAGPAFAFRETAALAQRYQQLHQAYKADATIYGKTTTAEVFTKGRQPDLSLFQGEVLPREDYIAQREASQYLIAVDPDGGLGWSSSTVQGRGPGYDGAHIIVILQENVSDAYLAFLQKLGISYLFGGGRSICFSDICAKLYEHFGIRRLLLQGGGLLDGSFAAEDLIDELSLLIAPVADCGSGQPSFFESMASLSGCVKPRRFVRKECRELEDSGLALQYIRNREEANT